jgi:hypothetical protein
MANVVRIEGDAYVAGSLTARTNTPSDLAVTNAHISATAAIEASKLQHQFKKVVSQDENTNAFDEGYVIHVVHGTTGTVTAFQAGSVARATGTDTCTVDLHKDGASILTGLITLDSANAHYTPEAGTINSGAVVAGDVLEVIFDATAGDGTLPTGVYASMVIVEDAA